MRKVSDKVVEKVETRILCSITFYFRKLCLSRDTVEKYCRAAQAADDNMADAHAGYLRTHTHTQDM